MSVRAGGAAPAPGVANGSWRDPRLPFELDGLTYYLDGGPEVFVLFQLPKDHPRVEVARYGADWRPRDVFTAAVCHRFHLVPPL